MHCVLKFHANRKLLNATYYKKKSYSCYNLEFILLNSAVFM